LRVKTARACQTPAVSICPQSQMPAVEEVDVLPSHCMTRRALEQKSIANELVPASSNQGDEVLCNETMVQEVLAASCDNDDATKALQRYSERFKSVGMDGQTPLFNRKAFEWRTDSVVDGKRPQPGEEALRAELERDLVFDLLSQRDGRMGKMMELQRQTYINNFRDRNNAIVPCKVSPLKSGTWMEDSDEEQVWLCIRCGLPLGDIRHSVKDSQQVRVHGECMALHLLRDMRQDEMDRREKERDLKNSRRKKHDIGWNVAHLPSNMVSARKMGLSTAPQGMCCLVLDGNPTKVQLAPTIEPASSVNLEYLSIALKVRRQEGREPLFSLDPVNPADTVKSMQVKRFEPKWLAGTSAGDVLFQADYYLKELSMGEYEQPVIGMRSCFDYSWDEGDDTEWMAREWFVVRKAEVHLSEDNVLIPYVRMGVEAWSQVAGADGKIEDAKVTRHNHPLLLYAESFTHNFDLIAERKSVIYHLRDLAKASVLAKFLVDSCAHVPDAWFNVGEARADALDHLEIPQLWNQRHVGKIRVRDGKIVDGVKGIGTTMHSVYGGVSFGLDRFKVAAPARVSRAMLDRGAAYSRAMLDRGDVRSPGAMVLGGPSPLTSSQAFAARGARPLGAAAWTLGAAAIRPSGGPGGGPQGVDLNLDKFELSEATRVATQAPAIPWGEDADSAIGNVFWSNLACAQGSVFKDEDRDLLVDLFNPGLSDRRLELDQFIPPDTSCTYIERLSNLMKKEAAVRAQRTQHFFSKQFAASDPGPLFPSSWKDFIGIEGAQTGGNVVGPRAESNLHERADYKAEAHMFSHLLKSASPVFDKCTEDGIRFRIYKVGSLEVRTTQKPTADEVVGVVFSIRPSTQTLVQGRQCQKVQEHERILKASVYVAEDRQRLSNHGYYLVLETDGRNTIVTEMLRDGAVTWQENPADVGDRNSLAKAFRSMDCRGGMTVHDMKSYQRKATNGQNIGCCQSSGKRYAQGAYKRALGDMPASRRYRDVEPKIQPEVIAEVL